MAKTRGWGFDPKLAAKNKLTPQIKDSVTTFFNPLLEEYKEQINNKVPNKEYAYAIDVYTKWSQSYFYFGTILKMEFENRIADYGDDKFARLEFVDDNLFNIAYKRHTGAWFQLGSNISLEVALEYLRNNPNLLPMF